MTDTQETSDAPDHGPHPDEWTGEGIAAMLAANPEPPAWYEQQPPAAS